MGPSQDGTNGRTPPHRQRAHDHVRSAVWYRSLLVLVVAAVVAVLGKDIVSNMMHKTRAIGWETPPGSPSLLAANRVNSYFPERMHGAILIAVEAVGDTPSVLTQTVSDFSQRVKSSVSEDSRVKPYEPFVVGYFLDFVGYSPPKEQLEAEFVSSDHKMTIIVIQPTKMNGQWAQANAFLQEWCSTPPVGYTLHITGMPAVLTGNGCFSGVHGAVNTRNVNFDVLFYAECLTFPLAMLIMANIVKLPRLLVLPLLTVIVSFVLSAALMVPWMEYVPVPVDAPAAVGSVTLALCLDYSLFILGRFNEQHQDRLPLQKNVDLITTYTGQTIAVSGLLVAIAFLGSMMLPERNLQGTGLFLGFATLASVGTSVILMPAVLRVAGKFFTVPTCLGTDEEDEGIGVKDEEPPVYSYRDQEADELMSNSELMNNYDDDHYAHRLRVHNMSRDTTQDEELTRDEEKSGWTKLIRYVAISPATALIAVLLVLSPLLLKLPELNVTGDRFALLPMNMPAMTALRRVQNDFSVGILDPYAILITAPTQGATVHLNNEVKEGLIALRSHDVREMVGQLKVGLSSAETNAVAEAVAGINDRRDLSNDDVPLDPKILAAVRAGATSAANEAHKTKNAEALKNAVREAKESGCSAADIGQVVAAVAAVLHAGSQHAADDLAMSEEAVKKEAERLGLTPAEAAEIAQAATKGARGTDVQETTLAAAKAGAAVGTGKLPDKDTLDSLRKLLRALEGMDITSADVAKVLRAVAEIDDKATDMAGDASAGAHHGVATAEKESQRQRIRQRIGFIVAAALMAVAKENHPNANSMKETAQEVKDKAMKAEGTALHEAESYRSKVNEGWSATEQTVYKRWPLILGLIDAVARMSNPQHGMLLMPSGYAAMLDLCNVVEHVGGVASMLGPTWALHQRFDWATAVALQLDPTYRDLYKSSLDSHVNGRRALLEVHTRFPSIGAGGANWVVAVREALADWEASHPGYTAEVSGGASEAVDMRTAIMESMWSYLAITVSLIMIVVCYAFASLMVPLRLALALFFTLAVTFGTAVVIYQTPLLHGIFPNLAYYDGVSYEVVPITTGLAIALGLDYDIFLVSRIVEFRLQRFSDRASIFRGVLKTGRVISGAGLIMALAFSGLLFSDKLFFQQFGVLLITSVLFDTFVVRTVLVPALMLMVQKWNWWPREMPPPLYSALRSQMRELDPASGQWSSSDAQSQISYIEREESFIE